MKTKLLFFGLSLICLNHLIADSILVQGEVSGEWNVDTVMVVDNIFIKDGESLSIEPGCLVQFYGHYSLIVKGRLDAKGTSEFPIHFTINDTLGFAYDSIPDGGWFGIRFTFPDQSNDSSLFEYCNFSFGKAVPSAKRKSGFLSTMDSCGGSINISGFDKVRISHCRFKNNYATYNGGAIYLDSSNALIENCEFIENRCGMTVEPWGYGGAICSDHAEPMIWNSYFEGNHSTGVGGSIAIRFKDGKIANCIFTENHSALGGAFGPEVYLFEPYSQANFYYCDVEGGPELFAGSGGGGGFTGQYYESIDQDPHFQLTGDYPYVLLPDSPAINTGIPDTTGMNFPTIDLRGMPRVLLGRIDMGAYESAVMGFQNIELTSGVNLFCYPNPASDLLAISFTVPCSGIVKLELVDIFGRKIKTIEDHYKDRGSYSINFDVSSMTKGVYICSLSIGIQVTNCKFVVN